MKSDAFIVTTKDDGSFDLVDRSVLDRYAIKADMDIDGSKQISTDGWDYTDNTYLQPVYDPLALCDLLELNVYHENCVDVVSRDSAGIGYDIVPVANKKDPDEDNKEILLDWFENLTVPINETLYQTTYDKRAVGYGAIELIREGKSESLLRGLRQIKAHTLRRCSDGYRVKQQSGTKEVWFVIYGKNYDKKTKAKVDVDADTGEIYPYNSLSPEKRANEIIWCMDYNSKSEYYGLPKIAGAIRAIHADISRADYNTSFFKNYGMPTYAVTITGDFDPGITDPSDPDYDETKTLKYKITQQLKQSIKNPHSAVTILIPSEGEEGNVEVKLQPLSVETKEASFRLFRKDNRDEVIHAHRVPPYKVGINETGSLGGSNMDGANENYKNDVIIPLRQSNEQIINTLIKKEFGILDWKFSIAEHDNRDYAKDISILKELFNMACATPRQIIENIGEKYGLSAPDNPYLDEYYLNGTPLDNVWNGADIPSEAEMALNDLEKNLTDYAGELDEQYLNPKGQFYEDGIESQALKENPQPFTQAVSDAFRRRKGSQ